MPSSPGVFKIYLIFGYTLNTASSHQSVPPNLSNQACRPFAATFARSNLLSWLSQTDLVGYPNKPVWGGYYKG